MEPPQQVFMNPYSFFHNCDCVESVYKWSENRFINRLYIWIAFHLGRNQTSNGRFACLGSDGKNFPLSFPLDGFSPKYLPQNPFLLQLVKSVPSGRQIQPNNLHQNSTKDFQLGA